MAVAMVDGTSLPTGFTGGIPVDNSEGAPAVAADTSGAITHYHQGLPFTAEGRIAIVQDGPIAYWGSGAAPFSSAGRLIVTGTPYNSYIAVPYGDSKVEVGPPGGSVPPVGDLNWFLEAAAEVGTGYNLAGGYGSLTPDLVDGIQCIQLEMLSGTGELVADFAATIFGGSGIRIAIQGAPFTPYTFGPPTGTTYTLITEIDTFNYINDNAGNTLVVGITSV
jgi:hypothetical protein